MQKKLFLLIALGAVIACPQKSQILKEFSDRNVQYIGDLYRELSKTFSGSFLVSPLSVQIIFALISTGAKGTTAKEIIDSLQIPGDQEKLYHTFLELSKNLQTNNEYTLSSANKIYLGNDITIHDYFENAAKYVFHSETDNIDFGKSVEAAAEMNEWVEKKTHNKIHDLISPDSLSSDTVAVMINALYYQGTWVKEFVDMGGFPFRINQNKTAFTDMMFVADNFSCYRSLELKAQFLELPYKGDEITMTFVLPNHNDGLPDLEAHIADVLVAPKYKVEPVEAIIPKFKIESTIPFIPILQALGINDAFTSLADFSGISNNGRVMISSVIQKTFIEVDEKGTTAAAATEVSFDRISGGNAFRFMANHPFLFYLKHKSIGVFFIGRYSGPEEV